jgi:hypothetical protein
MVSLPTLVFTRHDDPCLCPRPCETAAGQKYEGQGVGAAEARYIEMARSLGWPGLSFPVGPTSITSPSKEDEVDLEHLDDDDDDDPPPHEKHGGGSLGVHVSSLGKPEEDKDTEDSLHGYALSGDVAKLESLLESGTVDVNNRDQYVSACVSLRFLVQTNVVI